MQSPGLLGRILLTILAGPLLAATVFAAPVPRATGKDPGNVAIGAQFAAQACLDNTTGTSTGFQPALQVVLPRGTSLTGPATFLGVAADTTVVAICTALAGCTPTNPDTGETVPLAIGETLVLLRYPVGSLTPTREALCMDLGLRMASPPLVRIGTPVLLRVRPLFTLGADPLDNPATDPPLGGTEIALSVTPSVLTTRKSVIGEENETVNGPNFLHTATISVDVATGETVDDLVIDDTLPPAMQFVAVTATGGCTVVQRPSTTTPGGTLRFECGRVTGTSSINDRLVRYTFYVARLDAGGAPVLDPTTPAVVTIGNDSRTSAGYDDDANAGTPDVVLTDDGPRTDKQCDVKALAVQKKSALAVDTGAPGPSPGDTIAYTLNVQISDFFRLGNVVIADTLGDGQTFDATFAPTFAVMENGVSTRGTFAAGSTLTVAPKNALGKTVVTLDLAQALVAAGQDGVLAGDQAADGAIGQGATIATIVLRARIDAAYTGPVRGTPIIDQADFVENNVSVGSTVVDGGTVPPDGSRTIVHIPSGTLTKSVYALNGSTTLPDPVVIGVGDRVTFRLRYVLGVSAFERLTFVDFLPIPFFQATEVTAFDGASAIPPAGRWTRGPADTLSTLRTPALTANAADNTLRWSYGTFEPQTPPHTIDLLFTVTVTDTPVADRLAIANLVEVRTTNSFNFTQTQTKVTPLTNKAPALAITKDIVGSTNPSSGPATPLPAGCADAFANADAGDVLTIRTVVENTGSVAAFEVQLQDRFAQAAAAGRGFSSCTAPVVTGGTGAALAASGDLFAGTLALTDPLPARAQAVLTYTCTVDTRFSPGPRIDDTTTITRFAAKAGGTNFANNPALYSAKVCTSLAGIEMVVKRIAATSLAGSTPENNLNQGENATFEIVATLREGTYQGFRLTDSTATIPPVDCTTPPAGLTCSPNVSTGGATLTVTGTPASVAGTVTYRYTQQKTAGGSNTATAEAANTPPASGSTSWTVDQPEPAITKTLDPSSTEPGATVTFRLDFRNADPDNPLFQCTATAVLSATVFDLTTVAEGTTPAGYAFSFDAPSGTITYTATAGTTTCPAGAATFTARLRDDVVPDSTYTCTGTFAGRTLPQDHPNETAGATLTASDTATLTVRDTRPTSVGKTIVGTSEDSTDPGDLDRNANPPVAIGEVITYRIGFAFRAGTTRAVALHDVLPEGLVFVPGSATLLRSAEALTAAQNPGGINTAAPETPVAVSPTVAAGEVTLVLGDVTNTDQTPATSEAYVLTLGAVVANVVTNNAGTTLRNTGRLTFTTAAGTPVAVETDEAAVHVAEPDIQVTKTAEPIAVAGGDTVTFTLLVTNQASGAAAASAFDLIVADTLPARYGSPVVVGVDPGTSGATAAASFVGPTLQGTIDRLDPGETVTITYRATVDPAARFRETITNTATAEGTSLPGTRGTGDVTPGTPGSPTGERDASGGVNDLRGTGSSTTTVAVPALTKTTVEPKPFWAVGEQPSFAVTVGVGLGAVDRFVLRDMLPAGLAYVAGSLQVALPAGVTSSRGATLTETTPGFFAQDGNLLTFDFGTITSDAGGNLVVTYTTLVDNVIENQDGRLLTNGVTLSFADPERPGEDVTIGPSNNVEPVRVGEPNLELTKSITAGAAGADAGDTVSWQVTVGNAGSVTAYQVDWTDVLPAELTQITNAALTTAGGAVLLNGTTTEVTATHLHVRTTTTTNDTLDLASVAAGDAADTVQIAAGASLTITFDTRVANGVAPGQSIDNVTTATYTSLVDGGRNADDGGDDDDDDRLNNYRDTASQSVTVRSNVALDKTVAPSAPAVGETVTYRLLIGLIEGTTPRLVLTDVLPAGATYVSHAILAGHLGMTFGNPTYATRLGTGQTVQFDFGDVGNPTNGVATDDTIAVEITARIDNAAANQNGTVLANGEADDGSEVFLTFGSAGTRVDFDADASTPGRQGVPITVAEPELTVDKTVVPPSQSLGDVVTFTVVAAHGATSTADAFDLVVTDQLPAGLSYVPGSATLPAADVEVNGRSLVFRLAPLTRAAGSVTFTYQARIDATAAVGTPLTNALRLVWASRPGATGAPDSGRTGTDGPGGLNDHVATDSTTVTPTAAAFIDATKTVLDLNGGAVEPSDQLEYTIILTNTDGLVSGVVFTDPIPADTTYVPGSLGTTLGTTDESGLPLLRVTIGDLAAGGTVAITFRVVVNPGTPGGTVISNQGSVDSDDTVPEPTDADGNDANGDQPTEVTVGGGQLPPTLLAQKVVAHQDDPDASGDVTPGDMMRYTIVLLNRGSTPATNVVFTDTIPAGLTPVPGSETITGAGATIRIVAQAVTATVPILGPNGMATLGFDVTIDTPLRDTDGDPTRERFTNQGSVDSDDTDPTPTDQDGDPSNGNQPTSFDAVATPGNGAPAVDVQKRFRLVGDVDRDGLVDPGDVVEYAIVVTNTGSAAATDARLSNPIPPRTTLVVGSVTTSQGAVTSTAPIAVNLGAVPVGGVATVTFQVRVDAGTPNGTEIPCQAVVAGGNFDDVPSDDDGDPDNGRNPTRFTVMADADLALTKIGTPNPVGVGDVLTYTITVTNNGPDTAPNAVVTDTLPASVVLLSTGASQGSCTVQGTLVTCALGPIAPAGAATVTITVRPTAQGTIRNTAVVTGDRPDPNPGNNTDTEETDVRLLADLVMDKAVTPATADVGERLTYTLTVTNRGPAPATGVQAVDDVPEGLTVESVTASQGSCETTATAITCSLGELARDATATVTIVALRTSQDPITNTATTGGNEDDPDDTNNRDTVTVPGTREICDNCIDDNGNGLVDFEDPECCQAPAGMVLKPARPKPAKGEKNRGTIRMRGQLAPGTFRRIDPRKEDVTVQFRNSSGVRVCCLIPKHRWMKMFKNNFGFWDQKARLCPEITDVGIVLGRRSTKVTVLTSKLDLRPYQGSSVDLTFRVGDRCSRGVVDVLTPRSSRR